VGFFLRPPQDPQRARPKGQQQQRTGNHRRGLGQGGFVPEPEGLETIRFVRIFKTSRPNAMRADCEGSVRSALCGEEGEAEELGRVAQALVGGDQFGLAIRAR
jgi:hypothetical protein